MPNYNCIYLLKNDTQVIGYALTQAEAIRWKEKDPTNRTYLQQTPRTKGYEG